MGARATTLPVKAPPNGLCTVGKLERHVALRAVLDNKRNSKSSRIPLFRAHFPAPLRLLKRLQSCPELTSHSPSLLLLQLRAYSQ